MSFNKSKEGFDSAPPSYDEAVGGEIDENIDDAVMDYVTSQNQSQQIGFEPIAGPSTSTVQTTATLLPDPNFNVKEDVTKVRSALESKDRDLLIQVLCHRSTSQRHEIAEMYGTIYNIPLPRDIKNFVGNGRDSVLFSALTMPLHESIARAIHNSTNSYRWMCYIMFTLTNDTRYRCRMYYNTSKKSVMMIY